MPPIASIAFTVAYTLFLISSFELSYFHYTACHLTILPVGFVANIYLLYFYRPCDMLALYAAAMDISDDTSTLLQLHSPNDS
jgi:hypothetical protein